MSILLSAARRNLRMRGLATLLAAAILPMAPALAHQFKVGNIEIEHPWSRATPPGATVGAGYLSLSNEGTTPDRLLSATSPDVPKIEIHEMSVENGIMKMGAVENGIEIPAGGKVALEPDQNFHLMLKGLTSPLVEGQKIPATLVFEKAGKVDVVFFVDKIGAGAPAGTHDHSQ